MTIRQTSRDAYDYLMKSGALTDTCRRVYDELYRHGPCTAKELFAVSPSHRLSSSANNIAKRLGELRDQGVAQEVGERPSSNSKRTSIVFDVTDRKYPLPLPKKASSAEKLAAYRKLAEEAAVQFGVLGQAPSESWMRGRMALIDNS